MKFIAVALFAALVVVISADELSQGVVPILRHEEVRDEHGQYSLDFLTGDGTSVSEQGALKDGPEGHVLIKHGSYRYTSPEGQNIVVTYYADETGFHPTGDHFPVAPKV